jgi:hypothetical protein
LLNSREVYVGLRFGIEELFIEFNEIGWIDKMMGIKRKG